MKHIHCIIAFIVSWQVTKLHFIPCDPFKPEQCHEMVYEQKSQEFQTEKAATAFMASRPENPRHLKTADDFWINGVHIEEEK